MLSNAALIEHLVETGALGSTSLIEAFTKIDRKDFVPKSYQKSAYMDTPLPIGHSATISQPSTVAFMLELLEPQPGHKILDVGSGSGWTTALLASVVGENGMVLGLEIILDLVEQGNRNLQRYNIRNACIDKAEQPGYPLLAPYDRILVSAAAEELPDELLAQLVVGGIMVIPVHYAILRVHKTAEDDYEIARYPGFAFVPLQDTREKGEA